MSARVRRFVLFDETTVRLRKAQDERLDTWMIRVSEEGAEL